MATGKQGFVRAAEPQHSVSAQKEKDMQVQAPLTTMYIQAVPGLPTYPQAQPAAMQDAAIIPLPVPVMCSNQALPVLTLHITGGTALQQQRPETPAPSPRPRSAGKHVCPHCGRDCLKPSVLEKHLRCHTGERPYPCITCGISFKTQSNLYKHKRTQAHARLSSESGKGTFSSQESTESSREICSSPSLELHNEDSSDINKSNSVSAPVTMSTFSSAQVSSSERKAGSGTEWALRKAAVVGLIASPVHGQQEILNPQGESIQLSSAGKRESASVQTKSLGLDGRAPQTPNRTPLQRQEALFPKLSRGKSQVSSHDSTDSGFSESSEQHLTSSPLDNLHDRSMESLTESSMELQEPESSEKSLDVETDDTKGKVSVQEKQKLEEHILKLISENSVLVDDKHLVNVRPRKTVLSKQGSIDLPMPYTYKDSFHFEIKSSKQVSSLLKHDIRGRPAYSSVPTQHSTSLEHAPLTRSSSLPFSVGIQNRDRTASPYQEDSVPLSRRCSAGNIYPHPSQSVDQQTSSHRSLVRQVAMDCLSTAEGSLGERGVHSSLSSDGDYNDNAPEAVKKPQARRKKAPRFAYNKWYMYGGGTFKKLYNTEKESLLKSRKSTLSLEQTESQAIQMGQQKDSTSAVSVSFASCSAVCLPPAVNVLAAQTSSQVISSYVVLQTPPMKQSVVQSSLTKQTSIPSSGSNSETNFAKWTEEKDKIPEKHHSCPAPSERKKQKTEENISATIEDTHMPVRQQGVLTSGIGHVNTNLCNIINQSSQSVGGDVSQTSTTLTKHSRLNLYRRGSFTNLPSSGQRQPLFKRHSSPLFVTSVTGTSGSPSASSCIATITQAKSSFLPKYQLKIPCSTDGASDPCLGNSSSQNLTSPSQTLRVSHPPAQKFHHETNPPSASQSQSATVISSGPEQRGSFCTATVTGTKSISVSEQSAAISNVQTQHHLDRCTPTSVISVMTTMAAPHRKPTNMQIHKQFAEHTNRNISVGSVSSGLSQPLQTFTALGENQSVTASTTHSAISPMSHSFPSPINTHTDSAGTASVVESPISTAVSTRPTPGPTVETHASVCPNPTDGAPLEISHAAGVQFEGKMLLLNDSLQSLAQDTFYMRTADLQIVMQLISDEQLALIEPQIEIQDIKLEGGQSFPGKDTETSEMEAVQTGALQDKHKQCTVDTGTKLCTVQGNANSSTLSKIPSITATSVKSADAENTGQSVKNTFDLHPPNMYWTNTGPGVISRSSSKTEQHASATPESKANTLDQGKSLEINPENKALEPAGCDSTITSKLKTSSGPGLPSTDKPTKTASGPLHKRVSRNIPRSTKNGKEQSSQDTTGASGAVQTSVTSTNEAATSTEKTSMLSREKAPFVPEAFKTADSNRQPAPVITEQHKSLQLLSGTSKSADGEMVQTKTEASCVPQAMLIPPSPITATVSCQEEPHSTSQPSQPQSNWLTCASSPASGPVWSHTAYRHKPLNHKGPFSKDRPNWKQESQRNEACGPVRAYEQHSPQRHTSALRTNVSWSKSEEVTALTARPAHSTGAHLESERPVSKFTQEESIRCGEAPYGMRCVSQPSFAGPRVGGSLQSSQLRREAGTESQGWVPQEPESGGGGGGGGVGGGEARAGTWATQTNNTSTEQEEHARKNNEEGATGRKDCVGTGVKPYPCLSHPMSNVSQDTSLLAQLDASGTSSNDTAAFCEAASPSRDFGERECARPDSSEQVIESDNRAKAISLRNAREREKDPPGSQDRDTSTRPTDVKQSHPTCGHSLAHPFLVNASQEVKRQTKVKISATQPCQPRSSQLQRSEYKRQDTTKPSVPNKSCMAVPSCKVETCQSVNAMPAHTIPECTNVTANTAIQSNPTCSTVPHNIPTEPNPPQSHFGGSYAEEDESSSSSDDEGKLVIELE